MDEPCLANSAGFFVRKTSLDVTRGACNRHRVVAFFVIQYGHDPDVREQPRDRLCERCPQWVRVRS
jgi:hypothetical protein